jgi:hypothetical protein
MIIYLGSLLLDIQKSEIHIRKMGEVFDDWFLLGLNP